MEQQDLNKIVEEEDKWPVIIIIFISLFSHAGFKTTF